MKITGGLCPACRELFSGKRPKLSYLDLTDRYEHHSPPYLLKQASDDGCYICTRIWKQFSEAEKDIFLSIRWTDGLHWMDWLIGDWLSYGIYGWILTHRGLEFRFGPGSNSWKVITFEIYEAANHACIPCYDQWHTSSLSLREYVGSLDLASSTDSDQTWNTITDWWNMSMQIDENKPLRERIHGSSRDKRNLSMRKQFPTRLLDLSHVSLYDDLRLSVVSADKQDSSYITLSYRWRNDKDRPATRHWPWELTRRSLAEMQRQISFTSLPKTFRHAIVVTRRLRIRYLWIDALCIVQDDICDWKIESSKMGLIYERALCNIAAGVGDVDAGLFQTRLPKSVLPLMITAREDISLRGEKTLHHSHRLIYVIESDYLDYQLSRTSLSRRGWIVQERILSPRILHFLPDQVVWQEHGYKACEIFPMGITKLRNTSNSSIEPRIEQLFSDSTNTRTWNEIIRYYSATSLTKSGDKTVAILGLAQHWLSHMHGEQYCAGLWRSTFPHCLLWKVADGLDCEGRLSYRLSALHAPSWSWLSVNGKVDPFAIYSIPEEEEKEKISARILAIDLQPGASDFASGAMETGASIIIRGRLKSAEDMYWPMSTMHWNNQELNQSTIDSCKSLFSRRIKCSIDDMTAFLNMWNNGLPSKQNSNFKVRYFIYEIAKYAAILGFTIVMISLWLGSSLSGLTFTSTAVAVRLSVWHLTNFGSREIYFLEIDKCEKETRGLVVQRRDDGTYHRLGVFTSGHAELFAAVMEQDVDLR